MAILQVWLRSLIWDYQETVTETASGHSRIPTPNVEILKLHPFCRTFTTCMHIIYLLYLFSGWWLSMDPKDTFFKKLQPLEDFAKLFEKSERFGSWNQKTLGIVLVSGVVLLQYVFVFI